MAIDFRLVKSLTIPEGSVKSITDSNGVIIWQEPATKILVSIAVSGATTTFNVGNTWVFGGTVTATYSDGTTADVTADTTFSGYNMSTAGTQTVTATYVESGVTAIATYNITVYKVLTSITLSGQTTSLNRGAAFSFGGTVTAHYNDNSTATVTSSTTFSGYNMSTAGTYTVTASYTYRSVTKTATYSLTVNKAWTAIWTGSKAISKPSGSSNYPSAVAITNPNLTGSQTFRVTWAETTNTDSSGGTKYYYNNGTGTATKPGSPLQFTIDTSSNHTHLIGMGRKSSSTVFMLVLDYRPHGSSTRPGFQLYYNAPYGFGSNTGLKLTVTKIERYY